jgi:hypothetical protein
VVKQKTGVSPWYLGHDTAIGHTADCVYQYKRKQWKANCLKMRCYGSGQWDVVMYIVTNDSWHKYVKVWQHQTVIAHIVFVPASCHQFFIVKQNTGESGKSHILHVSSTSCAPVLESWQSVSPWIFSLHQYSKYSLKSMRLVQMKPFKGCSKLRSNGH